MIILKAPLNYKGGILEAGTIIGLGTLEEKLIASGAAEKYDPLANPEPEVGQSQGQASDPEPTLEEVLQTKTKAELLVFIGQAEIEDITDKNKKEEIIAALIEAVNNGFDLQLDTGE